MNVEISRDFFREVAVKLDRIFVLRAARAEISLHRFRNLLKKMSNGNILPMYFEISRKKLSSFLNEKIIPAYSFIRQVRVNS